MASTDSVLISIIIPTLDEVGALQRVVSAIPSVGLPSYEVLVVDGGSTDGTLEAARRLPVRVIEDSRRGYGAAVALGLREARGELAVVMDGDASYSPRDIPAVVRALVNEEVDVVVGSRLRGIMREGSMPLLNRIGNMLLSRAFRLLYRQGISDTQSGLQGWRRGAVINLKLMRKDYTFLTNVLAEAALRRLRMAEVPVRYERRIGRSKLKRFPAGFLILWYLIRTRLRA